MQVSSRPRITDFIEAPVAGVVAATTDEMNFGIQPGEPESLQVAGGRAVFGNVELTWEALPVSLMR